MSYEPRSDLYVFRMYTIDSNHIIVIPETEDVALDRPEFRLKQNVLALFPSTTCFYSSVVMSQPSRVIKLLRKHPYANYIIF